MRETGTVLMVVSVLVLIGLGLAQGVSPIPLIRRPRRPGERPYVSLRRRHHWKAADRLPDWVTWVVFATAVAGWLLSR
jgi:hypothetical protein